MKTKALAYRPKTVLKFCFSVIFWQNFILSPTYNIASEICFLTNL